MCLRLGNSSQNPYSFSGSHKEPRLLQIWLQLHFILLIIYLYYLASSHTQSASYPAIHPSTPTNYTPVDPSTLLFIYPSSHPPALTPLPIHLLLQSLLYISLQSSSHPSIPIYTPSIHPAIPIL